MIRERSVPFDPRCREAIEGGEGDKSWVLRVVLPGYRHLGRVIRAAKAIVGERIIE
jgi:molecular chaperone GrpE (heat shock protein)